MNYNPMKDKWNVQKLHDMLVQGVRLKNEGPESINFVSPHRVRMKGKKNAKGNRGTIMLMVPSLNYIRRNTRTISVVSLENMDIFKKIA